MTFHEHLQMYQKFDQIPFGKDKGNSNSTFVQNLTCKAAKFEFFCDIQVIRFIQTKPWM
jgi:hypothetical protein